MVDYEFPEPKDANELEVLPINITNLDKFSDFVTFDGKFKLTINPNNITKKFIDNNFKLDVEVSNEYNVTGKFNVIVSIKQLLAEDVTNANSTEEETDDNATEEETYDNTKEEETNNIASEKESITKKDSKKNSKKTALVKLKPPAWIPESVIKTQNKEQEAVKEEEVYIKPPEPPRINVISLGSKGELEIRFSGSIFIPPSWNEKWENDKKIRRLKNEGGSQEEIRRL